MILYGIASMKIMTVLDSECSYDVVCHFKGSTLKHNKPYPINPLALEMDI